MTNSVEVVPGLVVVMTPQDTLGWSEKMHNSRGNICLADGSAQHTTSASLQTFFNRTGTNINRLAVP